MDAEAKLQKMKEQHNARQKRYMQVPENAAKHKEANRASYLKRKEKAAAAALAKSKEEPKKEPKEEPKEEVKPKKKKKLIIIKKKDPFANPYGSDTEHDKEMKEELQKFMTELKEKKKSKPKPKKLIIKQKPISIEQIKDKLIQLVPNKNSAMTWFYSIQRIMKEFDETDFIKLINRKDLIEKLNSPDFKANTRQTNYTAILKVITSLKVKLSKLIHDDLKKAFQASKIKAHEYTAEPKENVITFDDYMKRLEDKFGKESKEFLIASIYKEVPVRDDLQLKIINSVKEATDQKTNYLVLTQSPKGRIIINHFKTENKHEPADVILTTSLTNKIKKFVNAKKDKTYLFTDKSLTSFVSKMNKAIGLNGGISLFRHMIVEDFLKTARTPEEKVEMAEKMKHSLTAQLHYLRNKQTKKEE